MLAAVNPERRAHSEWMDSFFASYYRHRPVNATFVGVHDFDDRLPDLSDEGVGDAVADARDLLKRSERASRALTKSERIDLELGRGFLKIQEWEYGSEHFQRGNPSLYTGEAVFGVIGLFLDGDANVAERVEAATARMHAVRDFLARARANVRRAPSSWTERAIRECDGALTLFTDGGEELEATVLQGAASSSAISSHRSAAEHAARAFVDHRVWLESELLSRTCDGHACGAEALDLYLKEGHFLDQSGTEVARYAEDQMAEAKAELSRRAADVGARTPPEALARLRYLHPGPEDYYARYGKVWEEIRRLCEERRLLTWPVIPIRFTPRPSWVRKAAPYLYFLFYRSPAAMRRPNVHHYLVAPLPDGDATDFLRANNDSVIKLNHVVHHGGLGHHAQNWHAFGAESRIGRMAAVDCASRIAMFCGGSMAEGWASYATDLAGEVGALTPLEQCARTHGRVRMAARALVDVRLHQGEMTLGEAAAFYEERAWMSATAARGEAVKNSMFPGAALMYLMGTDVIRELRTEMERRTEPAFDVGRFHDTLLSYGSIPVSLIAEEMKQGADRAE